MYKSRIRRLEERVDALERKPVPKPIKIEITCQSNSIGENIKARRQAMGMSQGDLASAIGVSVPMICQIERGTKSVTLMLGAKIAKILQCDLNDLVSESAPNIKDDARDVMYMNQDFARAVARLKDKKIQIMKEAPQP